MKYFIILATIVVFLTLGLLNLKLFGQTLNQEFIKYAIVALIAETVAIVFYVFLNRKRIGLVLHCKWLALWGKQIRFSMSYLYRIKINDKYLLVQNSNFKHQYQLVGGKYKRLKISQGILEQFEMQDDSKLSTAKKMKDDFALIIPAKNAIKFIDWFNTGKNREISHWREFHEELIAKDIPFLSHETFPYVDYNYVGRVVTPIKYTEVFKCEEILQYDILDLDPSTEQEKALESLQLEGDSEYIKWASEKLIENLGHNEDEKKYKYNIGPHTKWAINMKWSKK